MARSRGGEIRARPSNGSAVGGKSTSTSTSTSGSISSASSRSRGKENEKTRERNGAGAGMDEGSDSSSLAAEMSDHMREWGAELARSEVHSRRSSDLLGFELLYSPYSSRSMHIIHAFVGMSSWRSGVLNVRHRACKGDLDADVTSAPPSTSMLVQTKPAWFYFPHTMG